MQQMINWYQDEVSRCRMTRHILSLVCLSSQRLKAFNSAPVGSFSSSCSDCSCLFSRCSIVLGTLVAPRKRTARKEPKEPQRKKSTYNPGDTRKAREGLTFNNYKTAVWKEVLQLIVKMEEKKVPQHRRGHSSDLGKPGHSPRESSGKLDLSKLFEKLQEMKHADKNSTSLKKLQETLAYFIDQERILRNKVEKEASNTSPEKKVFRDGSTKEKKKYVLLPSSTSQPNFPPRTATSPQPHRRPSYELILHELASEIAALREFLTKRRTNKPLQKVASANKMSKYQKFLYRKLTTCQVESAAEESSFTGAENSFLSEADTDTLEDFSDDDGRRNRNCVNNKLTENLSRALRNGYAVRLEQSFSGYLRTGGSFRERKRMGQHIT